MQDTSWTPLKKGNLEFNLEVGPSSQEQAEKAPAEPQVFSVEQLNLKIKQIIEGQTGVIWVQGEISNFKLHSSGHFYFSLKDSKSQISAVMFRGYNSKLKFKPRDGLEVIVRGRISVYEPRGSYQILCEMMEPVGAGALQRAFEDLKDKLKREGLFETHRKKAIPPFPRHVAVVTSPTGAAIRDILNVMSRRAPGVEVTVVPTVVQGAEAAPQIANAFLMAQKIPGVDVIIIGRGGGSIEDLWAFNDEALARLISSSRIPVISAVGHEIDFTISDFVADLRAPTPSAAAELVAKSSSEVISKLDHLHRLLRLAVEKSVGIKLQRIENLQKRLIDPQKKLQDLFLRNDDLLARLQMGIQRFILNLKHKVELNSERLGSPQEILNSKRQHLEMTTLRMNNLLEKSLESKRYKWSRSSALLDNLSPLRVVDRGYSLVMKDKELIKSTKQISTGTELTIQFAEGKAEVVVSEIKE